MAAERTGRGGAAARGLARAGSWLVPAGFGVTLGAAVAGLPAHETRLADDVLRNLGRSGVENPVTAVLMNFRGYDTLLELSVLFLALVGVWSTARMPRRPSADASPVLRVLNQLLVPFLVLFAAYLLWAGSHESGGAFQAGAVLAAAGVLLALSDEPIPLRAPLPVLRILLVLGVGTFASVAVGTLAAGRGLLAYPEEHSKALILLIEAAATVSIGATLLAVFRGGRPGSGRAAPRGAAR